MIAMSYTRFLRLVRAMLALHPAVEPDNTEVRVVEVKKDAR
jgi:hypothetical protein